MVETVLSEVNKLVKSLQPVYPSTKENIQLRKDDHTRESNKTNIRQNNSEDDSMEAMRATKLSCL